MLTLVCPLSNVSTNAESPLSSTFYQLHPLVTSPLSKLNSLASNPCIPSISSIEETRLLFCGYLYTSKLLANPTNTLVAEPNIIVSYFPVIQKLANFIAANPSFVFPKLAHYSGTPAPLALYIETLLRLQAEYLSSKQAPSLEETLALDKAEATLNYNTSKYLLALNKPNKNYTVPLSLASYLLACLSIPKALHSHTTKLLTYSLSSLKRDLEVKEQDLCDLS